MIVFLYIGTILAIVNRNMPPESKVWLGLIAVCSGLLFLLYLMFGERRLSKRNDTAGIWTPWNFARTTAMNSCAHWKGKQVSLFAHKSLLSMDNNVDVYDGTASRHSIGEEMFESMLADLRPLRNSFFWILYHRWRSDVDSVLEILVEKPLRALGQTAMILAAWLLTGDYM